MMVFFQLGGILLHIMLVNRVIRQQGIRMTTQIIFGQLLFRLRGIILVKDLFKPPLLMFLREVIWSFIFDMVKMTLSLDVKILKG